MLRRIRSGLSQSSDLCSNSAMALRICGTVIAGVQFFSPPRFLDQEPRGQQRQRLVMMPPLPCSDLVVGQARFLLGALDALLDAMLCLGHARELLQWRFRGGVGEVIVVFDAPIGLLL